MQLDDENHSIARGNRPTVNPGDAPLDWENALEIIALKVIREHRPGAKITTPTLLCNQGAVIVDTVDDYFLVITPPNVIPASHVESPETLRHFLQSDVAIVGMGRRPEKFRFHRWGATLGSLGRSGSLNRELEAVRLGLSTDVDWDYLTVHAAFSELQDMLREP